MPVIKQFDEEMAKLQKDIDDLFDDRPALLQFITDAPQDPDTERTAEGNTYLFSQIAQFFQHAAPELTQGLTDLQWPNRQRPMPSMTVLQFQGDDSAPRSSVNVSRGLEVTSSPLPVSEKQPEPGENVPTLSCTFRTCRDLWLSPLRLSDVTLLHGTLNLQFDTAGPVALDTLRLDQLTLYLGHHAHTGTQLLLWLCHYLKEAELRLDDQVIPLPTLRFRVQGMAPDDEALLPYPRNVFSGYRLLQEYFCFPQAFLFARASGFPALPAGLTAQRMTLRFGFSRPLPSGLVLNTHHIRLHCTPAINLFSHPAETLVLQGKNTEHPLQASYRCRPGYDIFSVDQVLGRVAERPDIPVRAYTAFERFHHQSQGATAHYYRLHTRISGPIPGTETLNGFAHRLSFVRPDETAVCGHHEIISVQLTCTNRDLPTRLNLGDITHCTALPPWVTVRNITRPSLPLYPPQDEHLSAHLLSSMLLSSGSILTPDALRDLLRLHDLPANYHPGSARASQHRLAAIVQLTSRQTERHYQGLPVDGIESTLSLRQKGAFESEGELYLFGTLLAEFLARYASINTFHLLSVLNLDNKESYTWQPSYLR